MDYLRIPRNSQNPVRHRRENVDEIRRLLTDTGATIPDAEQRIKTLRSSSRNLAGDEALSLHQGSSATGSSAQWEQSAQQR
jgi:hypothetical protein